MKRVVFGVVGFLFLGSGLLSGMVQGAEKADDSKLIPAQTIIRPLKMAVTVMGCNSLTDLSPLSSLGDRLELV